MLQVAYILVWETYHFSAKLVGDLKTNNYAYLLKVTSLRFPYAYNFP
jgi:hypothetical protein